MARTLVRVALELLEAGAAEGQPPHPSTLRQLCRAMAQGPDETAARCTRPAARVRVHALLLLLSELAARGDDFATAVALGSGAQWVRPGRLLCSTSSPTCPHPRESPDAAHPNRDSSQKSYAWGTLVWRCKGPLLSYRC